MAKGLRLRKQHTALHRFFCGVIVLCFLVSVAAGLLVDARISEILERGVYVVVALALISELAIRLWAMWQRYE